jgi:hypothetical protein
MRIKRTKNAHNQKTTLVVVLSVVTVLILGASAYAIYLGSNSSNEASSEYGTNLERTETEKAASEALEDNPEQKLENEQSDTPSTPEKSPDTGRLAVNVLLSTAGIYNGTVSAGGMVTDYQEEGGTCTFTFTNGTTIITKTSSTLPNPTSMSCKTVNFPSSELTSAGVWKVKISYSSPTAAGTSNEKEITK